MGLKVTYAGDASGNGPSRNIWGDCPWLEAIEDRNIGYGWWDDFIKTPNVTQVTGDTNGYSIYGDVGVVHGPEPAVRGGVLQISANNEDNDESIISTSSPAFMVSDTTGEDRKLWFEARVKRASITDEHCAMFIGLAYDHGSSVPVTKTLCMTENEADLGAFSFLGFHVDLSNADAIDFVYMAEGQAQTVLLAGACVPVANTYNKLGFVYDPDADTTKRITLFVDNVEQTTYVTGTLIEAAIFPDAEPMGMVWATKVGEAVEHKAQMDWWRCFQRR